MTDHALRPIARFYPALILFVFAAIALNAPAQEIPKSIRGYRVHRQHIEILETADAGPDVDADAAVIANSPELIDISLTGVTFEIMPHLKAFEQSGKVDFLTFHNFSVNGIPVEIEEFSTPFEFRKREPVQLPEGIRIFTPTTRVLQAAWKEMRDSKKEWTVTGRVFVFGRFRKFGMSFKRVVPIEIELTIKNPLL